VSCAMAQMVNNCAATVEAHFLVPGLQLFPVSAIPPLLHTDSLYLAQTL
jgi:hypothetical protein